MQNIIEGGHDLTKWIEDGHRHQLNENMRDGVHLEIDHLIADNEHPMIDIVVHIYVILLIFDQKNDDRAHIVEVQEILVHFQGI